MFLKCLSNPIGPAEIDFSCASRLIRSGIWIIHPEHPNYYLTFESGKQNCRFISFNICQLAHGQLFWRRLHCLPLSAVLDEMSPWTDGSKVWHDTSGVYKFSEGLKRNGRYQWMDCGRVNKRQCGLDFKDKAQCTLGVVVQEHSCKEIKYLQFA